MEFFKVKYVKINEFAYIKSYVINVRYLLFQINLHIKLILISMPLHLQVVGNSLTFFIINNMRK